MKKIEIQVYLLILFVAATVLSPERAIDPGIHFGEIGTLVKERIFKGDSFGKGFGTLRGE